MLWRFGITKWGSRCLSSVLTVYFMRRIVHISKSCQDCIEIYLLRHVPRRIYPVQATARVNSYCFNIHAPFGGCNGGSLGEKPRVSVEEAFQ